jgi:hypothetical protein
MNDTIQELYTVVNNSDTIVELTSNYVVGTVQVTYESTGDPLDFNELGNNFIELIDAVLIGDKLIINYKRLIPYSVDGLLKTVEQLSEEVATLKETVATLTLSLDNRINIETFTAWKKMVEKKLNINLDEDIFYKDYQINRSFKLK